MVGGEEKEYAGHCEAKIIKEAASKPRIIYEDPHEELGSGGESKIDEGPWTLSRPLSSQKGIEPECHRDKGGYLPDDEK